MSVTRRVKGAFVGVLFGLLMVPGSVILHAWNEYRTIHRSKGLAEAEQDVVSLEFPEEVNPELNNHLIHLSGLATTDEVLRDDDFSIRANAIHLRRRVEMYQWVESEHRRDDHTTYEYDLEWHEGRINSESFHRSNGHENPRPEFGSHSETAKLVTLGAFQLSAKLLSDMDRWESIEINQAAISEAVGKDAEGHFLVSGTELYWSRHSANPDDPQLGDQRMFFEIVQPAEVSLIAAQTGDRLGRYRTSNGETIEDLYYGRLSAAEVVGKLKTENAIMAWMIRLGGFVLCGVGISLLFGPARALVSWIPMVGDVTGFMIVVASFLIAAIISLTTISVSWIAVRPLLGISLLFLTGILIAALLWVRKTTRSEPPVIDHSMLVS